MIKVNDNAPKTKVEDVGGTFGFRVQWTYTHEGAAFAVWKIVGRQPEGLRMALFLKSTPDENNPFTPDVVAAEVYLTGAIKPDGRVMLGGEPTFAHPIGFKMHFALLKTLWQKAHKLMGVEPVEEWK